MEVGVGYRPVKIPDVAEPVNVLVVANKHNVSARIHHWLCQAPFSLFTNLELITATLNDSQRLATVRSLV